MKDAKLNVKIILPSMVFLDKKVSMAKLPGAEGIFCVLPGHENFVANLDNEIIILEENGRDIKYYIDSGIARVSELGLNIMTEFAAEIDSSSKKNINKDIKKLEEGLEYKEMNDGDKEIIKIKIKRLESLLKFV